MFVGIDVASERLDVAFGEAGPARTYANDIPGLEALNQTLIDEREAIELIVVEATGGTSRSSSRISQEPGFQSSS